MSKKSDKCETCFRIACQRCDWVANDKEVLEIQKGSMTECPKCGWIPGQA